MKKINLVHLLVCVLGVTMYAETASAGTVPTGTAQETSPTDNSQMWELCNSGIGIATLVANKGNPKNPIFYQRYKRECHQRLKRNTFLWVESSYVAAVAAQANQDLGGNIYMRKIKDDMLKVVQSPTQKNLVLVEISPRSLKNGVITIKPKKKIDHKKQETIIDYDTTDITEENITVKDKVKTCLDFGGYSWLKAVQHVNINELRMSFCHTRTRTVTIPNTFRTTAGKYKKMSGQKETIVYVVEVIIKVQNSENEPVPLSLPALKIVNRLAIDTLQPKP